MLYLVEGMKYVGSIGGYDVELNGTVQVKGPSLIVLKYMFASLKQEILSQMGALYPEFSRDSLATNSTLDTRALNRRDQVSTAPIIHFLDEPGSLDLQLSYANP